LEYEKKPVWAEASPALRARIFALAEDYKDFLNRGKTERLAAANIIKMAQAAGFKPLNPKNQGKSYVLFQNKAVLLAVPGQKPWSSGFRLLGAHIDAPRLDLKMNPLFENQDLVYLKTHYYGGVKKYHWFARQLAIHGVVCRKNGAPVEIDIGEAEHDPVLTICDLLPHLSRKSQEGKKLGEAFEAERMNALIASLAMDKEGGKEGNKEVGKEPVKKAVLELLARQYGLEEEDLISAELEIVPAGPARDVGLDRSMIGAYAQDDRICVYAGLKALLETKAPPCGCLAWFMDKEEIGSEGPTSANSKMLEYWLARLMEAGGEKADLLNLGAAFTSGKAVSADVNAAYDPDYPEVYEKRNAAFLGCGVNLTKYTGHGGKYGSNDANAEYVAWMRGVWARHKVCWQAAELGKIDEGGGGTIAKLLAVYGMEVLDVGPALLSMHSPFEISHKADLYATVAAYKAFYEG
jgi:aspartyl aminopeptidase